NKAYEGKAPAIDLSVEAERQNALLKAIKEGVIQSATDLSEGGLAVALSESLFAHSLGAHVNLVHEDITTALFSETQSRFLVSVKEENKKAFEQLMPEANHIGHVTANQLLTVHVNEKLAVEEDVQTLNKIWKEAIPCLMK